jgi:hypothetical protein
MSDVEETSSNTSVSMLNAFSAKNFRKPAMIFTNEYKAKELSNAPLPSSTKLKPK